MSSASSTVNGGVLPETASSHSHALPALATAATAEPRDTDRGVLFAVGLETIKQKAVCSRRIERDDLQQVFVAIV